MAAALISESNPMKPPSDLIRRTSIVLLAGLAIGFLSGWVAGRQGAGTYPVGTPIRSETAAGTGRENPRSGSSRDGGSSSGSRSPSRAESKAFAESVRSIFRETIEDRRVAMFEKLLDRVGVENYAEVVSLVRENDLRGSDTGEEWSRLWANWGRRDPAAAFAFLKSQDWSGWDPAAVVEAGNKALTSWSQTNPEQARRFVEESAELSNGDRSMVYGLVRGWSDVDPMAAAEWLSKTGLGKSGEYKSVVEAISRKGGREALDAWFSALDLNGTSSQDKSGYAQQIAQVKQEYEPEKAAAWVQQHLGEAWLDESEIVQSTAQAFARRDPQGAMEWAVKTGLESASLTAMNTWAQQDLEAASTWLSENSRNPAYSSSAELIVSHLRRSDPAAAKTWAEGIPDPAMRVRMLHLLEN